MSEEPYTPNATAVKECYMYAMGSILDVPNKKSSKEFQRFLSKFYESAREDERYDRENKYH